VNASPRIILTTPQKTQTIYLSEHRICTIGRDPANFIQILDRFASRFHAKIEMFEDRHCCFYDLNSSNGSLHNGQTVTDAVILSHGDHITIGSAEMLLKHGFVTKHDLPETNSILQVLMIHSSAVQGKIWQEIFLSQDIPVIWEIPGVDLKQMIGLRTTANTLPQLLIIDVRAVSSDVHTLSRWCRTQQIKVQILLIDSRCTEVAKSEQSQAKAKGFVGLYPAFSHRLLLQKSELAKQVQTVLNSVGRDTLKYSALFKSLETLDQMLRQSSRLAPQQGAAEAKLVDADLDDMTALKVDPRRKLKQT
jgi:FHA domain